LKKLLISLLKIGFSVAIIGWLVRGAIEDKTFDNLSEQFHNPGFDWIALAGAVVCCAAAVLLTIVRWHYLVRALGMEFSMLEALRIGCLGYLFNLAPLGIIVGDLLKAVMLGRLHHYQRARAFATVIVDRVVGLYMLFVVASAAILLTGFYDHEVPEVRYICLAALLVTAVSTLGLGVLMIPGVTRGKITRLLGGLPYAGRQFEHLIDALRMYRRSLDVLVVSCLMSVFVHGIFTLCFYLLTLGIYQGNVQNLTLQAEFVVSPLINATGVIPLSMGPMEYVLNLLYDKIFDLDNSQGFVVALGYRIITLLIATVGFCFYLGARREVSESMHEAAVEDA
jgi:glycosyltransferase 2 family protein